MTSPRVLLLLLFMTLPAAWKDWRLSRELTLSGPGLTAFLCPHEVYDHPGTTLADIRIVDDKGTEVPFVTQTRAPHKEIQWHDAKLVSEPSKSIPVVLTIDTGEERKKHNAIRLQVLDQDFLWQVNVSVSDAPDKDWVALRSGIPIYRYTPDGLTGSQTISYPEMDSRYVHLSATPVVRDTVPGAAPPAAPTPLKITRAEVGFDQILKPDWNVYSPIFTPDVSTSILQTWWRSDALIGTLPVTGISFTILNRDFHRALRIQASPDRQNWREIISAEIFRTADEHPYERTTIEFPEMLNRYWRIQFYDNGQAPVIVSKIELMGVAHHVVFQAADNVTYHLLYGNGKAAPATYDSMRALPRDAYETASLATVGGEEVNTVLQHGWMFWAGIAGGIAAVIGLIVTISLLAEGSESHKEDKPV